jgi:hypothetical protein
MMIQENNVQYVRKQITLKGIVILKSKRNKVNFLAEVVETHMSDAGNNDKM